MFHFALFYSSSIVSLHQAVHGHGTAVVFWQSSLPPAWRPLSDGNTLLSLVNTFNTCLSLVQDDCMTQVELVFRVLGCFNLSRGFFIFLIFVCKRSTLSKVRCNYKSFTSYSIPIMCLTFHEKVFLLLYEADQIYITCFIGKLRKSLN